MDALERHEAAPAQSMTSPDPTPVEPPATTTRALPTLCPYLATADGNWRSSSAVREHRCAAATPPVPLALEKQRRLCLVADHVTCATYGAAVAAHPPPVRTDSGRRAIARTTPVILDHGRFQLRLPAFAPDRISGQGVLVALLALAFVAILIARPAGGGATPGAGGLATSPLPGPTTAASSVAEASPAAESQAAPSQAPVVTARPITSAAPGASVAPSGPPASTGPAGSGETYKVKSGDTLSAIAKRFKTTVKVLVDLNKIADPSRLRVGQVLLLP